MYNALNYETKNQVVYFGLRCKNTKKIIIKHFVQTIFVDKRKTGFST